MPQPWPPVVLKGYKVEEAQREKKIILVVEDTQMIADMLKELVNSEPDYQAVVARDGAEALEAIKNVQPNLILLDLHLPGMDGFAVYDLMRANPTTAHTPVLFMTASRDDPRFVERDLAAYLIAKPFLIEQLLQRIENALQE